MKRDGFLLIVILLVAAALRLFQLAAAASETEKLEGYLAEIRQVNAEFRQQIKQAEQKH